MSQTSPRILLVGATGKTGNAVAWGLSERDDVELVGLVAPSLGSDPTRAVPTTPRTFAHLDDVDTPVDVVVDFTTAAAAEASLRWALDNSAHVVLGTTGIADDSLTAWGRRFSDHMIGLIYAPNFAIGAVLMMRFAREAAPYFDSVEIVETHNAAKLDAPSGTARETARQVAQARDGSSIARGDDRALGELVDGVPVHSLRMSGAVAHQDVVFGAPGQALTIRHDARDRSCYSAGVARAAQQVQFLTGLTIGLESVL